MNWYLIFFDFAVGAFLLLAVNIVGGFTRRTFGYTNFAEIFKSDFLGYNVFIRCLAPSVLVTFLVIALYFADLSSLVNDIWISVVWYTILFTAFLVFSKRIFLINLSSYIFLQLTSITIAYIFYSIFWIKGLEFILPDETNFRTELWVLLLLFGYALLNSYDPNPLGGYDRKRKFYLQRYHHLKNKYFSLLPKEIKNNQLPRQICFAIMVVEDFNRGPLSRFIERILHPLGLAKSTGIMQVSSPQSLSDKESIELGCARILKSFYSQAVNSEWEVVTKVCRNYNPDDDYCSSVWEVFVEISQDDKKIYEHAAASYTKDIENIGERTTHRFNSDAEIKVRIDVDSEEFTQDIMEVAQETDAHNLSLEIFDKKGDSKEKLQAWEKYKQVFEENPTAAGAPVGGEGIFLLAELSKYTVYIFALWVAGHILKDLDDKAWEGFKDFLTKIYFKIKEKLTKQDIAVLVTQPGEIKQIAIILSEHLSKHDIEVGFNQLPSKLRELLSGKVDVPVLIKLVLTNRGWEVFRTTATDLSVSTGMTVISPSPSSKRG